MSLIYAIHDEEGSALVPAGGWCVALAARDSSPRDYRTLRSDISWLVRFNWGYGSVGTIPKSNELDAYVSSLLLFLSRSSGIAGVIIGNEPNHEAERPEGVFITPDHYAECFVRSYRAVKQSYPYLQVLPAAVAPYHASPLRWTNYLSEVYAGILARGVTPDALNFHAYTRSHAPSDLGDESIRMGDGVLQGQYAGFLTYLDALRQVPPAFRHLPAHITEFCPLQGWDGYTNSGLIQAAYAQVAAYNARTSVNPIYSLALYRYPHYDRWGFEGNVAVLEDYRSAVAVGTGSPQSHVNPMQSVFMPIVHSKPATTVVEVQRELDPRAIQQGVKIVPTTGAESPVWRAVKVVWYDEQEADQVGPDRHLLLDVLDQAGQRKQGVSLRVSWSTGSTLVTSEAKPGEPYSANFPFSPGQNAFSVQVVGDQVSEQVTGLGMGAETPDGFNPGIHTSTGVVFQLLENTQAETVKSELVHPVKNPAYRTVTQGWLERPEYYQQLGLAGHEGVDFATPVGSEVVAVDTGSVIKTSGYSDNYGIYILLGHRWGESIYAHLSTPYVQTGDIVKQGQVIALSGNTGNSTGPHLHFGIRVYPSDHMNGTNGFIDPLPYLKNNPAPNTGNVKNLLVQHARSNSLDPLLILSLAWAESSWQAGAQSQAGAMGVMQLMPATWDDLTRRYPGETFSPWNPEHNIRLGCVYFKQLLTLTGSELKSLYAYNWGIGNVLSGRTPPPETIEFANKILHGRDLLRAAGG